MWPTLCLTAALTLFPAQAGQLRLSNERATFGLLGATRSDDKVLPGDIYWVTFTIENLKVGEDGQVQYSMAMELLDRQNKPQFKQDPQDLTELNSLGGTSLPAFAHAQIGTDTLPGEYVLKVTVTDRSAKQTATLMRKFQVLPREFGLVRIGTSYDGQGGLPAPFMGVAGQTLSLNFATVGFQRDAKTKQPNIRVEMRVLDQGGQPVAGLKPFVGEASKDVPEAYPVVPMQFMLKLNRPGKFRIELKATDQLAKKTATHTFDLNVSENK